MKSPVAKRSIVINGHKTSVSLEDAFCREMKAIARDLDMTLANLVTAIDSRREQGNLSSAIRLFVLSQYRQELSDGQRLPTYRLIPDDAVKLAPNRRG